MTKSMSGFKIFFVHCSNGGKNIYVPPSVLRTRAEFLPINLHNGQTGLPDGPLLLLG